MKMEFTHVGLIILVSFVLSLSFVSSQDNQRQIETKRFEEEIDYTKTSTKMNMGNIRSIRATDKCMGTDEVSQNSNKLDGLLDEINDNVRSIRTKTANIKHRMNIISITIVSLTAICLSCAIMSLIFPIIIICYVNRNTGQEQEILNVIEATIKKHQEAAENRDEKERETKLHRLANNAEGKWKLMLTASRKIEERS